MHMPSYQPSVVRHAGERATVAANPGGLSPQGCNVFEWLECGAVAAVCGGLSGPALVACVAAAVPDCVKCVT